jgi:hypothetical protein
VIDRHRDKIDTETLVPQLVVQLTALLGPREGGELPGDYSPGADRTETQSDPIGLGLTLSSTQRTDGE